MTTSGTTSFNLELDELFDEAYGRVGIGTARSGNHIKVARRNLNILLSEWDNRGVHLWKVKLAAIPLVLGQAEYNFANDATNYPNDINDVLEAYIRNNTTNTAPVDVSLTKIDRSAYAALPNKLSQGTPSQYYVERKTSPSVFLYQTPGTGFSDATTPSNYQLKFYYLARIEDGGRYTNTADVVFRFLPCLTSGLSYYLSISYKPEKTEMLKLIYEDEMQRALQEDGQRTSLFISPKTFYGDGV